MYHQTLGAVTCNDQRREPLLEGTQLATGSLERYYTTRTQVARGSRILLALNLLLFTSQTQQFEFDDIEEKKNDLSDLSEGRLKFSLFL